MFKPVQVVSEHKPRCRAADDAGATAAIELPAASFIELCLRGERRVIVRRGFDKQLLGELLAALEGLPSTLESLA